MDLFNIYGTSILLKAVENIEEKIFNSSGYVYFDNHDSTLIQEYKKFEVTIISTALVAIFFEIDITNIEDREKLRTIYLGKTADFQRIILSKELKIHDLDVSNKDKSRQESMLNLKIGAKFEEYFSEIRESIKNESIYYSWEGEERMYSYLWNLFLCYEDIDFEVFEYDQKCIKYKIYFEVENRDLLLIENFIREMNGFRN